MDRRTFGALLVAIALPTPTKRWGGVFRVRQSTGPRLTYTDCLLRDPAEGYLLQQYRVADGVRVRSRMVKGWHDAVSVAREWEVA